MKKSFRLLIAILITAAAVPFVTWNSGSARSNDEKFRKSKKPVRDQYIVVLKSETAADEVEPVANELLAAHGGTVRHVYTHALKGFSIQLPEAAAIALSRNPRVDYVQEDSQVTLDKTETTTNWNLDRIDQRNNERDDSYYFPNVENGAGVHAYILDTGLRVTHREFSNSNGSNNRATADVDKVWWDNQNGNDRHWHGTAVAALIGGNTFGVAKAVRLHGVRVLDSSGDSDQSTVLAGVDWVTANHIKPAVVNMSLGFWVDPNGNPLDDAVRNSIAQGITYVVTAGNNETDSQNKTPARITEAITVGATNANDARSWFSNFGPGVDLFAPGEGVVSASINDRNGDGILNDATDPIEGTSFAAPLVAGVAARFLQVVPNAAPAAVQGAIVSPVAKRGKRRDAAEPRAKPRGSFVLSTPIRM